MKYVHHKKHKLVVLLFFVFSASFSFGQVIKETAVDTSFLQKVMLENQLEVLEKGKDYLLVMDEILYYLDLDPQQQYIRISSTFSLKEGASLQEVEALSNALNKQIPLLRNYYSERLETISFEYYFWIKGGFTKEAFWASVLYYKDALSEVTVYDKLNLIR